MYQRTNRAAVWGGAVSDDSGSEAHGVRGVPAEKTIWARTPYRARRGRCVAVRVRGDHLLVALAGSPTIQWLPVREVLTVAEVVAWLAAGF